MAGGSLMEPLPTAARVRFRVRISRVNGRVPTWHRPKCAPFAFGWLPGALPPPKRAFKAKPGFSTCRPISVNRHGVSAPIGTVSAGFRSILWGHDLALPQFWCSRLLASYDLNEAGAEQIELGATIHLALEKLELGDLAFGLAIAPRRCQSGTDGGLILTQACGEGA